MVLTHDAKRYLEWPMLSDTHYPGITRTRQAWTYFPFLRYNSNKELHYSLGIFRHPLGLICPGLHPWVTSQLAGLLHLPVKPLALNLLLNNKHDSSCHWEWPAAQACSQRGSFLLKTFFWKQMKVISQIEQVISHFIWYNSLWHSDIHTDNISYKL